MKMIALQMFCSSGKLKNLEQKTIPVDKWQSIYSEEYTEVFFDIVYLFSSVQFISS